MVEEYNKESKYVNIYFNLLMFEFGESHEVEVISEIIKDYKKTYEQLSKDIEGMKYDDIKKTLLDFKGLDIVIPAHLKEPLKDAVSQARKIARDIKRRTKKLGESFEAVKADINTDPIDTFSFAFLDLADNNNVEIEAAESVAMPELDLS